MNYLEKLAEATKCYNEAKALLAKPDRSAEETAKIETLIKAADALKAEAAQLKDIEAGLAKMQAETAVASEQKDKAKTEPESKKGWDKDWAAFLYASWRANHKDAGFRYVDPRLAWFKDEKEPGMEKKSNVENVGASGGFLVPAEFLAQLQAVMGETSLVRPRATVIRMNRRQVDLPVLDQTGTTAGRPHWFGGMRFYWGEEAAAKTETNPSFREVSLVAHKLYGYTTAWTSCAAVQ